MATLQELESRNKNLKQNLEDFEEEKAEYIAKIKGFNATMDDLEYEISELQKKDSGYPEVIKNNENNPEFKAILESQWEEVKQDLEAKEKDLEDLGDLIRDKGTIESKIEEAIKDNDGVLTEFASDPRINEYLQERLEINYNKEIKDKQDEKKAKEELAEKFSLDLKSDAVFKPYVEDLIEKYNELQSLPDLELDPEDRKRGSVVRGAFTKSFNKLKKAMGERPEYADIVLSIKDVKAIIEGPNSEGKYELPTFKSDIENIDKVIDTLEERKVKLIERIKADLVPEKIDEEELASLDAEIAQKDQAYSEAETEENMFAEEVKKLDEEIKALRDSFATIDTSAEEQAVEEAKKALEDIEAEMKTKNDKIDEINDEIISIENEFKDLKFNKAKLEELTAKADIPDELREDKEAAQKEYDETLKKLKDKGYIHPKVYPAIETEECQKAFEEFKKADYAVRKAFLDCRTDNSDAAKDALKKAMEDYTKVSNDLLKVEGMEGLTVENWHDYLVRGLEEEAKKREIDEVYYEDTFKNRLKGLKEEYSHVEDIDDQFSDIEGANEKIEDLQEAFLKGKKVDFDKDVSVGLIGYVDAMGGLFKALKDKGEAGLESVGDLFKKLGAKIAESKIGKWFSKIKDFAFRKLGINKKEISGSKTEEENETNANLLEELEEKAEALEKAELAIEEHLEDKLTPEETQEMYEQEEKQRKAKELHDRKKAKEAEKDPLNSEVDGLLKKQEEAQKKVEEKQKELEAAKAKVTGTPEQQAKLAELEKQREDAAKVAAEAEQRKLAAQKEKGELETAKSELKPTRPESVVENANEIAHGEGQELVEAYLDKIERELDEER